MPVESWITPDDTAVLAAQAMDRINVTLTRLGEAEQAAFWASVRKCYNTPYNDPTPRLLPASLIASEAASVDHSRSVSFERSIPDLTVPMVAMPISHFVEAHAS